jgi:hypothetical protein
MDNLLGELLIVREFLKSGDVILSKKSKVIITTILLLIIFVVGYGEFNREIARRAIYGFIAKQGIKENQLKYTALHRDYKFGGYWLSTYVEGEKPDIYYNYAFRDNKIYFQAYYELSKDIKKQLWGGSGLTDTEMKKLRYPPPNQ